MNVHDPRPRRSYLKALDGLFMPARIKALPIDDRGYPVPWFVAETPTGYDFRVIAPGKFRNAVAKHLCWVCGQRLGSALAFTIGPMCAVNRISSEPPAHLECARFAAQACPFLANPRMVRNEKNIPEDTREPPGQGLKHNPGTILILVTPGFRVTPEGLISIGPPRSAYWYTQGRLATPEEAAAALERGIAGLRAIAETDPQRVAAVAELERMADKARRLLPTT